MWYLTKKLQIPLLLFSIYTFSNECCLDPKIIKSSMDASISTLRLKIPKPSASPITPPAQPPSQQFHPHAVHCFISSNITPSLSLSPSPSRIARVVIELFASCVRRMLSGRYWFEHARASLKSHLRQPTSHYPRVRRWHEAGRRETFSLSYSEFATLDRRAT